MSAIGAIFMRERAPAQDAALARMESALRIHGPDRQSRKTLGEAGLVSCLMLGFTPEDRHERQPVFAPPGLHLVLSGWISNRDEIEPALGIERTRARTMPDSALALAAWREWGEGALDRLDGDFALIVWDERSHCLKAARSVRGAPPLHWHENAGRVVLATAPKGIHALGDVPRELDEMKLADSLVLNYNDAQRSFFNGISRLLAGSVMTVSESGVSVRRYFDSSSIREVRYPRDDDYVEAAREILERSVRRALRANETPAVMLSSGLDSTTVAVTAIEMLRRDGAASAFPLVTYTAVPEAGWQGGTSASGANGDESARVRSFAAGFPEIDPHFIDSAGLDFTTWLDRAFLLGEVPPRAVNNLIWYVEIMRQSRAAGKRVMLTGGSGNATISASGPHLFPELLREGRFATLWRQVRAMPNRRGTLRSLVRWAIIPQLPPAMNRAARLWLGDSDAQGFTNWSAINPRYAQREDFRARMRQTGFDESFASLTSRAARAAQFIGSGANEEAACVAMGVQAQTGVQVRDPLGSRALLEFCLGMPTRQSLWNGIDRRLVRRIMAGRLPDAILNAPHGEQGADSFERLTRRLPHLRRELDAAQQDKQVAEVIDIDRLMKICAHWPEFSPQNGGDFQDHMLVRHGFARGITALRYMQWIRGINPPI